MKESLPHVFRHIDSGISQTDSGWHGKSASRQPNPEKGTPQAARRTIEGKPFIFPLQLPLHDAGDATSRSNGERTAAMSTVFRISRRRETRPALLAGVIVAGLQLTGITSMMFSASAQAGLFDTHAEITAPRIVQVRFNGRLMQASLDGGMTVVALPLHKAREAGINPGHLQFSQPMWTPQGKVMAAWARLKKLELDGLKVQDVEVLVAPGEAVPHPVISRMVLASIRQQSENGEHEDRGHASSLTD